ncbi:hypothetical protein J4417_03430 [Candidatus Woesearchaeota archaeon]|nr:hypothetical protein [Candidatus Woesearchaeota archaeon]
MVCPKLVHGDCKITQEVCKQPYKIKMIDFKACAIYKRAVKKTFAAKNKTVNKKVVKKKAVHRKAVKKKGRKR